MKQVRGISMAFIEANHRAIYLLPPSLDDWLPEGHLARFTVDVVGMLDLQEIVKAYRGNGLAAYPPHIMVALLFYGYATGVFSSRKLERGTYDSVALRYIAAGTHPDHDTIATFRRKFLPQIGALFEQLLHVAAAMNVLRIGSVCIDGTKVQANASKHKALSYAHACKIEKQLQDEVKRLLEAAEQADAADLPDECSLPEELAMRENRLAAIAKAKKEMERRAAEREEAERREYEAKKAKRAELEQKTGRKPRGKDPKPPATSGPGPKDQVNLTDEESRIMPVCGGGFEQSYNAQAGVDTESRLIVSQSVTQHCNDKKELVPALEKLVQLPEDLGCIQQLIADSGFFSEANIQACESASVDAYIAVGREKHHPDVFERFSEPAPLCSDADPGTKMRHKLRTVAGRAVYALRKQVVEPVFGIIKSVLGFRQLSLRGLDGAQGEWSLVCTAYNLKRLHKLITIKNSPQKGPKEGYNPLPFVWKTLSRTKGACTIFFHQVLTMRLATGS
jgi:transposase